MEKHHLHLKNPELQNSNEVQDAVEKKERLNQSALEKAKIAHEEDGIEINSDLYHTKIPNNPKERIEAYTERLENIFLHPNEETRKRNIEMFREDIHNELIIKKENFPESYFELQQRIAKERGQAIENIPDATREQMMDVAITDQKASLDAWIDYLSSNDAVYPAWFKYFVWKNITKLSQFDKEKGEYKKRTKSTVAPYPDIYREPLAQIADIYENYKENPEDFSKRFPDLYAELTQKSLSASMEGRETVEGQWVKYEKGKDGDAKRLFKSLEGKGTGWCTAGAQTAEVQINSGDFYVFYSNDDKGVPSQPRLAIRMQDQNIGEVRGVLQGQAVEPALQETLDEKLKEFGSEADKYKKKSEDMKMLTFIDNKVKDNPNISLSKQELQFIYQTNSSIEGFGYGKDPRIAEILETRNSVEDVLTLFELTKEQLATKKEEITEQTKLYIGELYPNIFKELPQDIEHIYTKFPEQQIYIEIVTIPEEPKTPEECQEELEKNEMKISDYGKDILQKADLAEGVGKTYKLIILTVASLGFKGNATRAEIQARAKELGFGNNFLPAITGPELRLQMKDQKSDEWILIDMESIAVRLGNPGVFYVFRDSDGLWLSAGNGHVDSEWDGSTRWAFAQD